MKNWLLGGIVAVSIMGCSALGGRYDSNEYTAFTNVAHVAHNAKSVCSDPEAIRLVSVQLLDVTKYANLFTKHQPNNDEIYQMSTILVGLVQEFSTKSTNGMSATYCNAKIDIIISAAEIAMSAATIKGQ